LVVYPSDVAVESIEEAGYAVEEGACPGMQGHVVEGGHGEKDADIACQIASVVLT
jgi:hypothetical protein